MKSYKEDILEIMPKIKDSDEVEDKAENLSEKPFEEIFKEFYKKERDVEPQKEVLDLLLSIMNEEGDDSEAN